jgi:hypothetical protein
VLKPGPPSLLTELCHLHDSLHHGSSRPPGMWLKRGVLVVWIDKHSQEYTPGHFDGFRVESWPIRAHSPAPSSGGGLRLF